MKSFGIILLASERSGSNLLRILLGNHSNIFAPIAPHLIKIFYPVKHYYCNLIRKNNNKNLLSNSYTGLDAPATTSAITYDIRLSSSNDGGTATLYLNRASLNSDNNTNSIGSSSLTLMEIGV